MVFYCDIIGVCLFVYFENCEDDYIEKILNQFIKYFGKFVFFMEVVIGYLLQVFVDLIIIEEYKKKDCFKVVLIWVLYLCVLFQVVFNLFVDWMNEVDVDFVIIYFEGYELDLKFVCGVKVEYNQMKVFEGVDFIYVKNWVCFGVICFVDYGKVLSKDMNWMVDVVYMVVINDVFFMYCLLVRRNMIVIDEVIEVFILLVIFEVVNWEIFVIVVLKRMLEGLE